MHNNCIKGQAYYAFILPLICCSAHLCVRFVLRNKINLSYKFIDCFIGVSLSEPHINGVSSRNHCIPMVQRTYVRNSNCKRYGKQLYTLMQI